MNERIKQLAEQAEYSVNEVFVWDPTGPDREDVIREKFAELIVRECALVVHKKTGPKSALNVLEHFGVEE